MFLGPDTQKRQVVLGIEVADDAAGLGSETSQERRVLHCSLLVERRADRDALHIDYYDAFNALVRREPLDGFLDFRLD